MAQGKEYQYERIDRALERQDEWYLQQRREIVNTKKTVQAKLEISQSGDAQELEADTIAKKVVNGGDANVSQLNSVGTTVQSKSENGAIHASAELSTKLESGKGSGQSMDDATKSEMETKMGTDFSGVKIHTGAAASEMSESINAKAFTYGQDVYFKNGNYNPSSNDGKELLAHELTHTVQQGGGKIQPKIQRFEPWEHTAMGNAGSENMKIQVGELTLTFGELTAMADYFIDYNELKIYAEQLGNRRIPGTTTGSTDAKSGNKDNLGNITGSTDEILYVLEYHIRGKENNPAIKAKYSKEVIDAVEGRSGDMLRSNWSHFSNSKEGDQNKSFGSKVKPNQIMRDFSNNETAYRWHHNESIKEAFKGNMSEAWLLEGFGSHFVTDAFSAGHVQVERESINDHWKKIYPMWRENLDGWFSESVIQGAMLYKDAINNILRPFGIQFTNGLLTEVAKYFLRELKYIPLYSLGDLVGGMLHDYDNVQGVNVKVGGNDAILYGDNQIIPKTKEGAKSNADKQVAANETFKLASQAVKVSVEEIKEAEKKGSQRVKTGKGKSDEVSENEIKEVQKSIAGKNGLYRAEEMWPTTKDAKQTDGRKKINWKVNSFLTLLGQNWTIFDKLIKDYSTSRILPALDDKASGAGEGFMGKLAAPIFNYLKDKLGPKNFRHSLLEVIDYTPGKVYGTSGILGYQDDELAEFYLKKVKGNNAMGTLTVNQRARLLRDFLEGPTVLSDNKWIAEILHSTPAENVTQVIDKLSHGNITGWEWIFEDLSDEYLHDVVKIVGPRYWKGKSIDAKRGQIRRHALFVTGHISQLAIISILETMSPEEIRRAGNDFDLDSNLDGSLNDKYWRLRKDDFQKKSLEISQSNDPHEIEADKIARSIIKDEPVDASKITPVDNTIHRKEENNSETTPQFQTQLESSKGNGQSLPENVQKDIGGKMGVDLSDVKVHTDSTAHNMSENINAKAFAHGQDIYFKDGNYNPDSKDGKELLAHELVHTQQQKGGVQKKLQRQPDDPRHGFRAAEITLPFICKEARIFDPKTNVQKLSQKDEKGLTSLLIGTGFPENSLFILQLITENGNYDYRVNLVKTQFIKINKQSNAKITWQIVTGEQVSFIANEPRTAINANSTTTSNIVTLSDNETATTKHVVNEAIKNNFDLAKAKVLELTGNDLGTSFGDVKRPLNLTGGSSGSDNITWHKTGRAIDLDQGQSWIIRLDKQGDDMYFILYMKLSSDLNATIDQTTDNKYIETFTKADKDSFQANPVYDKKLVNVTHILEDNGFSRIKAHSDWKTNWAGQEWWHYEKRDGLTMYEALRQVHTEQEIVDGYKSVVTKVPKTRHSYESRFIREGFPPFIVKGIYPVVVKFGSLSLYLSVGDHQSNSVKDIADFPDDVAAVHNAMFQLGYSIVSGANIVLADDITAIKDISKRLLKKEQSAIIVGDSLHQNIGTTLSGAITKTNLKLYSSVGKSSTNLPADVKAIKEAFNRGFAAKKLDAIMKETIIVNTTVDDAFLQMIDDFQVKVLKVPKSTDVITKGGATHTLLGTY